MNIENTTLVYFSPTDTTRVILEEIAKGIGKQVHETIDITKPEIRSRTSPKLGQGLVLMGAPVYAGRLPNEAARYFKTLQSSGAPAVLVVLYGNREFDDALLELKHIALEDGFLPLAAGAFIGEHSFCSPEFPIARNRPDADDLKKAFAFGKQIAGLLSTMEHPAALTPVDVPGNLPYREIVSRGPFPFIHVSEDCDGCGVCVTVCPENAIDASDRYSTRDEDCIRCCACIKACPLDARIMKESPIKEIAKMLSEKCTLRKEPQTFLSGK